MQINNIKVLKLKSAPTPWGSNYGCYSPNGKLLEDFVYKKDAAKWAKDTKDFIRHK